MSHRLRRRAYLLFEVGAGGREGSWFDAFIMVLVLANVLAVILETVDPLYATFGHEFLIFEIVSVVIFSIEYLGRLWVAPERPEYDHPIHGRVKFAVSSFMLIDLLAILPFFSGSSWISGFFARSDSLEFSDCSKSRGIPRHCGRSF